MAFGDEYGFGDSVLSLFGGGESDSVLNPADYTSAAPTATQGFNLGDSSLYGGNFPISSGIDFNPSSAGEASPGILSRLGDALGMSPGTKDMVSKMLPFLVGGAAAVGGPLIGSALGSGAAKDIQRQTQRIAAPTPQEQSIMNMGQANLAATNPASRSVGNIQNELSSVLAPFIERMIAQEGQGIRRQGEGLVGSNMAYGGVLPQQRAYLMAETNKNIAKMISDAVMQERQLRTQEGTQMQNIVGNQALNQQQNRTGTLMTGQQQATGAAQAAGRVPMDAATLGALIAAIFSGQQNRPNYG